MCQQPPTFGQPFIPLRKLLEAGFREFSVLMQVRPKFLAPFLELQ
jgi:hypothetical protein